jgi:hypothetical protein
MQRFKSVAVGEKKVKLQIVRYRLVLLSPAMLSLNSVFQHLCRCHDAI